MARLASCVIAATAMPPSTERWLRSGSCCARRIKWGISTACRNSGEKEKAGRIRFLDHEEQRRLFESIGKESDVYQRLCIFLVDTGARLGEGLGLQWGDIVERRATFWVTKSGRSRSVPLTARAYDAVFASEKRGKGPFAGIDQQRFRTSWHAARHTVGLGSDDDVVPHILRHTCASRLV